MDNNEEYKEDSLPKRLNMHSHNKSGKSYRMGYSWTNHIFAKGKWIKRFINANVGHNYDTVYSDFLKKIKSENVSQKDEKELINIFKYQIFNDGDPKWKTEWTLDSQNRIIKNKEYQRYKNPYKKKKILDDREVVSVSFHKEIFNRYPGLYEKFVEAYGNKIISDITNGPIPYDQWRKYFVAERGKYWSWKCSLAMERFMNIVDKYNNEHNIKPLLFYNLRWEDNIKTEKNWCGIFTFNYTGEIKVLSSKEDEYKRRNAETIKEKRKARREDEKEQEERKIETVEAILAQKIEKEKKNEDNTED